MRSSAGIVAGLLFIGLAANCGGSDSNSGGTTAGSANLAGQGGEGNTGNGGKSSAGTTNKAGDAAMAGDTSTMAGQGGVGATGAMGGAGGMPPGCSNDADCGATAKCVDTVCKKNDGQACTAAADCQNNCVDSVCTPKKDDGADCTSDDECAHSCITGICAPVSDVGGDCDVNLGAGGAGGAGGASTGGAGAGGAGAGGEGANIPQNPDCKSPLQCISGKCLTPDGQACTDNVDCINTCVKNLCQPKSTIDGACDDKSDCAVAALVCDETSATCKLDLLQQCTGNDQCKSSRCICSDANCAVRTCKAANSTCLCRWSPPDSTSCNQQSAALNKATQDPNGCDSSTSNICNNGQCVLNAGGDCTETCKDVANGPDGNPGTMDDICAQDVAPGGCNTGYSTQQKDGGCHTVKNLQGTYYCTATCACTL